MSKANPHTFIYYEPIQYNTNFIPLSYIEHVKHEAYVQKRKYLCSVMEAIEKTTTHTHSHTHIATQCNGSCC